MGLLRKRKSPIRFPGSGGLEAVAESCAVMPLGVRCRRVVRQSLLDQLT
jgi:hypothetical protein